MRNSLHRSDDREVFTLLLIVVLSALLGTFACGTGPSGTDGSGGDPGDVSRTPPPNPLGNRTNPLQTYIRTHWTDGDPDFTGGLFRSHIKIYGHSYTHFEGVVEPDLQAQFVADNYDAYMGGGKIVGDRRAGTSALSLYEPTTVHTLGPRDSIAVQDWLDDPSRNLFRETYDDVVMHYKWDVTTWYAATPGWNPNDDNNDDGCRDGTPSDPGRTAACIQDAEVRQPNFSDPTAFLRRAKIRHPAYIAATVDRAVAQWGEHGVGAYHFDAVAYEDWSLALDKTFTYEGFVESDPDHPMRTDLLFFVPTVIDAVETELGTPVIHFANTVSPYYTCAIPRSRELSLRYIENTFNENWLVTGIAGERPMSTDRRADYLDCPFVDYLEKGKGYVFSAFNRPGTDRGKRFSLALFYMINHQLAFYYYRTDGHGILAGEYVWDKQWNPYVNFDVGQPAVNSLDLPDFQGNLETNRYFVFESQPEYEVIGREYERGDGVRVLVLAKIMARDAVEGADPTGVDLPGTYRPVQPDLSLGAPVARVEMVNNDGLLLVESP